MAGEDGEWSVGEYFPESLSLEKGTCAKQAVGQSCGALSTEAIGTLMKSAADKNIIVSEIFQQLQNEEGIICESPIRDHINVSFPRVGQSAVQPNTSKHCSIQNGSPHNGDHKDARFKANLIWRVAPEEQFGPFVLRSEIESCKAQCSLQLQMFLQLDGLETSLSRNTDSIFREEDAGAKSDKLAQDMRCPMLQNFKENLTCKDEQLLEQQMLKRKMLLRAAAAALQLPLLVPGVALAADVEPAAAAHHVYEEKDYRKVRFVGRQKEVTPTTFPQGRGSSTSFKYLVSSTTKIQK
ncbi:hypothetical protein Anapl_18171 [Anas platyrhynchos]|uniref:Uncharacterized protein n=1 Tax=Anas platyrhynchos TaxID=8839 RepID=R0KKS0_ANAPL|nr:hypothetical protein Anapl_18171 [Anas platyrhynchos]